MPSFAILTNTGRNKEAASLATGVALDIVSLAWGDGDRIPAGGETSLLNELGRKPVQAQGVVSGANNTAFFDILLDETEGPFVIREAGLFDADGDLVAIAKYDPVVNKPLNTVSALLRINIVFSDLENLVLQVSSTNAFVPAERQINTGVALLGGGDLSNDRTISADIASQSEALAGTRHDKVMTPLRVAEAIVAAISALLDGAPDALDTLNELATALGDNDNAMAAIITQIGLKLDATSYTAADILAKIIDEHAKLRSLYINSLGHVGDGGNDYGLIIKAFEPAITLADRSDNAGSVQIRSHADGALWLLRDVLNDTTIGHSSNTTTKVFVKFTRGGPVFYDNSGTEIGRITSAGFVGAGTGLTGVNADKVDGLHAASFVRTDAGNYRIPLGSFSNTNYDGIVYSDDSNFFKFLADQNVTASEEQAAGNIAAGRLRLIATNDLSLSSTAHAFQIGKTNSANIGMDNNEMQARDNGAASNLYLNSDGGDVRINGHTVWHDGNTDHIATIAPDYEATLSSWSVATMVSLAHGLASTPSHATAVWVCTSATNGFSVGDEVPADYSQYNTQGVQVSRNSSVLKVGIRAAWVLKEDASSYFTINTDANWDLKVRAWL